MIALLDKGGLVMLFIILLSLVGTIIIIERLIFFKRIQVDEETLLNRLKATLGKGHFDEAISICENNPSPLTNIMRAGIDNRHYSEEVMRECIVNAANMEIPRLEQFLPSLGTIAHVAPLLGLLGTVTGNIQSFGVLGGLGNVGDPGLLAKGISEALLTTAAGIIVSIPAISFYNHLVSKVNHIIIRLENRANELVRALSGGNKSEV